jgi:uncharacterized membrane protein YhaH (DUF805 family)
MSLSPYEQHPSQFKTPELRERPRLTLERVIVALAIALAVLAFGFYLHWTGGSKPDCLTPDKPQKCPSPAWSSIPLPVWVVVGILVGVLVVAWPWIKLGFKRLVERARS